MRRQSRLWMLALLAMLALGAGRTHPAAAQAALLGPGAAYVSAGASSISIGELNSRLSAHGYPAFGRTAFGINIGAYRALSSGVMLSAEWHGLIMEETTATGLGGGYGTLGVGYSMQLSPRLRVYPRLGIGAGGLGMWFENESDTLRFDDVLSDPSPGPDARESVLSRGGLVVDIGAGAEFIPSADNAGLLIGLRLGYLAAPFDAPWDYRHERQTVGGPDATIAGPYIRVLVGGALSR